MFHLHNYKLLHYKPITRLCHWCKRFLCDIEVDSSVVECEGEPCLFVNRQDEFAATCRLKNFGVAIAEPFSGNNPF